MNNTESALREKLHNEFEKCVKEALEEHKTGQSIFDDLIIKAAVGSFYQGMKEQQGFALMCDMIGINYEGMLDEECNKVLDKYLTIR